MRLSHNMIKIWSTLVTHSKRNFKAHLINWTMSSIKQGFSLKSKKMLKQYPLESKFPINLLIIYLKGKKYLLYSSTVFSSQIYQSITRFNLSFSQELLQDCIFQHGYFNAILARHLKELNQPVRGGGRICFHSHHFKIYRLVGQIVLKLGI